MNKALAAKERKAVASLSSRADPTSRRVSFTYHVDGYDIPGGWQALMEKYYDVMYSESYDDYDEEDEDDEDDDEEDDDDDATGEGDESKGYDSWQEEDKLLSLLVEVREQLQQGDYRSLYAVWGKYGYPNEEPPVPHQPPEKAQGRDIVARFAALLD